MQDDVTRRIVLTGGPGAGKSAVLGELAARGYACVPESARAIIRARKPQGLSPRPAPAEFAEAILLEDTARFRRSAHAEGPVFFDRGVVDALGMIDQLGLLRVGRGRELLSVFSYDRTVFMFPPWREIYTVDAERDQTFDESVVIHDALHAWYRRCGYTVVEVPRMDVAGRCDVILKNLL